MEKTYAVTGVASGIGAAVAKSLKSRGNRVIGFDLKETTENVDQFIPLDLNDPRSITNAAGGIDGGLDGICNIAGLPPRDGLEAEILQVNFLGQRAFTQELLPRVQPGAAIVNMASRAGAAWRDNIDQNKRLAALSGPEAVPEFVASENIDATRCYNLSKEAMILWTLAMTERLIARDIRINSLSPGAVATGILDDFARVFGDRMKTNIARAGRAGQSQEIAAIVVFLLSDESSWLKGADIPVDGGMGAFNMADAMGLDAMTRPLGNPQ